MREDFLENIPEPIFFLAVRLVACMAIMQSTSGAKKEFLRIESENILLQLSSLEILVTPHSFTDADAMTKPDAFRFTGNNVEFDIYSDSEAVKIAIDTLMSN